MCVRFYNLLYKRSKRVKCIKYIFVHTFVHFLNCNSEIFRLQFNMESLVIFTLLFGLAFGTDNIVKIDQGLLRGSTLKARNGRDFKAFQGIPYAKPPIKELRFEVRRILALELLTLCKRSLCWRRLRFVVQNPIAADPWDDVLDATVEKDMCIQKNLFMYQTYNELLGVEDCLYLNVYTPNVSVQHTCGFRWFWFDFVCVRIDPERGENWIATGNDLDCRWRL